MGYRYISIFQIGLTAILIISLPLWKQFHKKEHVGQSASGSGNTLPVLTLKQIFQIPGAREILFAFFCYSAVEQTSSLWASSYLVLHLGYSSEKAAGFASLFFIGITVGRGISGFITFKLNDSQMIHLGEGIILLGVLAMLLPLGKTVALAGLILIGLGCAPIYPSIIHSTPAHFGADKVSGDHRSSDGFRLYRHLPDAPTFWYHCKIHKHYTLSGLSWTLFMYYVLHV